MPKAVVSSSSEKNKKSPSSSDSKSVEAIFKAMADRHPEKRKVKPISRGIDILSADWLNDTSSDDEDYKPKEIDDEDDMDDDDDDDDDEDDDDDDDDDNDDADDADDAEDEDENKDNNENDQSDKQIHKSKSDGEADFEETNLPNGADINTIKFELPMKAAKLLVCSICLGENSHESDEIVECDSCGVTVHEGCYGITNEPDNENESVHSNASSSSTEPWFCDSCLANIASPCCDLCPNLGGIFKQTDVKRWVHLVCALYIPGVAFADTNKLTGVTLFELPYDRWGSKVCSLCEDERLSRTGICISCDAGLCKSYFHVTCAQSHGLLSEAQTTEEIELVDPFYAHCKAHASDKCAVKTKRRNWLALESNLRIKRQQGQKISERIMEKLEKARAKWEKSNISNHPQWIPTQKLPRLLITSSSAVKRLLKKAELLGLSPQTQYIASHDVLDIRKKWHIPPAFSVEFVSYYLDRNNRMVTMQKRFDELKSQYRQLKALESSSTSKLEEIMEQLKKLKEENSLLKSTSRSIWTLLASFMNGKLNFPKLVEIHEEDKKDDTGDDTNQDSTISKTPPPVLVKCGLCHKSHDYQKLVLCDSCKIHYHLYCLDPPLAKMPKKTRYGFWQCSDCTEKERDPSSGGENESEERLRKRRRLRENVKGPKKFVPDADANQSHLSSDFPLKKKRKNKRRKSQIDERRKEMTAAAECVVVGDTPIIKNKRGRPRKNSLNPMTPNLFKSNKTIKSSPIINVSISSITPLSNISSTSSLEHRRKEEECCKCKTMSSVSKLVQCDHCLFYYHFGCLTPPTKKSPKQKGYRWYCEDCDDVKDANKRIDLIEENNDINNNSNVNESSSRSEDVKMKEEKIGQEINHNKQNNHDTHIDNDIKDKNSNNKDKKSNYDNEDANRNGDEDDDDIFILYEGERKS